MATNDDRFAVDPLDLARPSRHCARCRTNGLSRSCTSCGGRTLPLLDRVPRRAPDSDALFEAIERALRDDDARRFLALVDRLLEHADALPSQGSAE